MRRELTDRQLYWIVGLALFISYAYFYQAGGWNQNSRFALVRAILEQHTLQIDAYRDQTGDRAVSRGHYYSDKAPGASLIALVPVGVARGLSTGIGVDPASDAGVSWTSYVATVATSGAFTVVAALGVMWLARFWGYSQGAAVFAATAYGLASPAWCYATLFMGHGLTAGCLMIAFAAAVAMGRAPAAGRNRLAWLLGLFAGVAVLSEFPAAVPVALIVVLGLLNVSESGPQFLLPVIARIAIGGGVSAAVLFGYHAAAFGSPFHIGYASEEGFDELRTGLFGITYPSWQRLQAILVGSYRGLLPISPLIAITPFGLIRIATTDQRRRSAIIAAAIAVFYLLLNASYFYWEGGWVFGPRHVSPALPFLALGLAPLWEQWGRIGRAVLVGGWAWGAALALIAVSTTPQPPATYQRPLSELLVPAFQSGRMALNTQRFTDFRADAAAIGRGEGPTASWNLGMKIGLTGRASLLPLGLVWIAAAGAWIVVPRRDDAPR